MQRNTASTLPVASCVRGGGLTRLTPPGRLAPPAGLPAREARPQSSGRGGRRDPPLQAGGRAAGGPAPPIVWAFGKSGQVSLRGARPSNRYGAPLSRQLCLENRLQLGVAIPTRDAASPCLPLAMNGYIHRRALPSSPAIETLRLIPNLCTRWRRRLLHNHRMLDGRRQFGSPFPTNHPTQST